MSSRYHIHTSPAPAPFEYPARFRLGDGDEYVKYGHAALPQERRGGDPHWTPEIITQTWYQAETGKIPISGAGYGGPFAGPGFDAMWLDMSEIVRPTRDGIHGREYISTAVDLGRELSHLEFGPGGELLSALPPRLSIPLPVLFDPILMPLPGRGALFSTVRAAARLGTFALVGLAEWDGDLLPYAASIAPLLAPDEIGSADFSWARLLFIETDQLEAALSAWEKARALYPRAVIALRLPMGPESPTQVDELARRGVEIVSLLADDMGQEQGGDRPMGEVLRAVHGRLVESNLRDTITLLASGGIAAAEHVPKAVVCGADAVGVDLVLLIALGCALWADVRHPCTVEKEEIDPAWGEQRLVNLMAAWRDQLLEVLGAMGMREVRRLRGELGRAIFYAEEEKAFRQLFRSVPGAPPAGEGETEGDLRWTMELILATSEQARTGVPPTSGVEYRVGKSGGGFDRLRFVFETGVGGQKAEIRAATVRERPEGAEDRGRGAKDQGAEIRAATVRERPEGAEDRGRGAKDQGAEIRAATVRERPEGAEDRGRGTKDQGAEIRAATVRERPEGAEDQGRRTMDRGGQDRAETAEYEVDLSLDLNRRDDGRPQVRLPQPWYGGGMSFGSVGLKTMLSRAKAAQRMGTFTCTGEGGYPEELVPYGDHVITQVATGLFGVREETIQRARIVEFKYAQGAKPGLGGHLLGNKVTADVAALRESVQGCSLFSPFPFHSVYSVEDHKKHVDWIKQVNPQALISVKVSTPTDVDMVAVGSYYAGAHIVHLDGAYGGTGAAPEIAKKNIAMPIEYAIRKVHAFLEAEGIRDQVVVMASGGVRTAYDIAKAIALGADGCVIGTADLVALGCLRLGTCEREKGCPLGIATTDPALCHQIDPEEGGRRIANLYRSWRIQLADILRKLGLRSVRELRGRVDLLVYLE